MTCVVGAGGGKGLCETWHLFLRFVWGTPWLFFHSVLPLPGARVLFLVRELRSHRLTEMKPHGLLCGRSSP